MANDAKRASRGPLDAIFGIGEYVYDDCKRSAVKGAVDDALIALGESYGQKDNLHFPNAVYVNLQCVAKGGYGGGTGECNMELFPESLRISGNTYTGWRKPTTAERAAAIAELAKRGFSGLLRSGKVGF